MANGADLIEDQIQIDYFKSRWKWTRPNLITLANNPGRYFGGVETGVWLPDGVEYTGFEERTDPVFLILSDHNRQTANLSFDRIGDRKRMINGDMRSYFIADKMQMPLSWDAIPSRSFSDRLGYVKWLEEPTKCAMFTVDGGAGGGEMHDWWQRHRGSMWAFMNMDIHSGIVYEKEFFEGYTHVYEVIITDFSYDIVGRSQGIRIGANVYSMDLWDVSMTLEEV